MTEQSPKLLLFDIGNVIVLADHAISRVYLQQVGVTPDNARLFLANPDYSNFSRGKIDGEEFHKRQTRDHLQKELPYEVVREAHDVHMFAVDVEMVTLLRALVDVIEIAFATDTNPWQTQREKELIDLTEFGDTFFRSDEVGRLKVDPGFFEYVLETLNLTAQAILFIDDSPEKIAMAQAVGMQTVLFKSANELQESLQEHGVLPRE